MLLLQLKLVSVQCKGRMYSYISLLLLLLRLRELSVMRWAADCELLCTSWNNILQFEGTFFFSVVVAMVVRLQTMHSEEHNPRERW
jgi:hypothetical protein